jgi:hypothetical protein
MAILIPNHLPIRVFQTQTNTTEQTGDYPEAAGQTFLFGTPVVLNATGFVVPSTSVVGTADTILGIAESNGFNLPTDGAGAPGPFGQVGFPGAAPTYGSVPNQPLGVNIPAGVTFVTGRTTVALAVPTTVFIGQTDASTGVRFNPTIADIGKSANLVADGNGHWYVDIATIGTGNGVTIRNIYSNDFAQGSAVNGINNAQVTFTVNMVGSQAQI